jgi:hypothetical protein
MELIKDAEQPHIGYETCSEHGMYFDTEELSDYREVTLFEKMTKFIRQQNALFVIASMVKSLD